MDWIAVHPGSVDSLKISMGWRSTTFRGYAASSSNLRKSAPTYPDELATVTCFDFGYSALDSVSTATTDTMLR